MRLFAALVLIPICAYGDTAYDMAMRPVVAAGEGAYELAPGERPTVAHYFVESGNVRADGPNSKTSYLFKGGTMYVIDRNAHTVHAVRHATLRDVETHYADAVRQLDAAAAHATDESRADALRKAEDLRAAFERMRRPVARRFRVTTRFESVDGRACRIWEVSEDDLKRMELCVAPVAGIAGGTEMLGGMQTLARFRQGADFALGVDLGLYDWWPEFSKLGGVPLLVRAFKYDTAVSEVMISNIRPLAPEAERFELPGDYAVTDGPEYTLWYVR